MKVWDWIANVLSYITLVSLTILMAALPVTALLATFKWFLRLIEVI